MQYSLHLYHLYKILSYLTLSCFRSILSSRILNQKRKTAECSWAFFNTGANWQIGLLLIPYSVSCKRLVVKCNLRVSREFFPLISSFQRIIAKLWTASKQIATGLWVCEITLFADSPTMLQGNLNCFHELMRKPSLLQ